MLRYNFALHFSKEIGVSYVVNGRANLEFAGLEVMKRQFSETADVASSSTLLFTLPNVELCLHVKCLPGQFSDGSGHFYTT